MFYFVHKNSISTTVMQLDSLNQFMILIMLHCIDIYAVWYTA
jgi:hypothetical protein